MANLGNTTIFGELKVSLGISSKNKTFLYDSLNQILKLTHINTIGIVTGKQIGRAHV